MNDDSQILIARLLTHQTLRRDDKLVKRALSDELFRQEVDARLLATPGGGFALAAKVLGGVESATGVDLDYPAVMGSEDFAHMLRVRPGCYAFIGNGDGGHRLPEHGPGPCIIHNTSFDFNDEIIPIGASYFVKLAFDNEWITPSMRVIFVSRKR